MGAERLAISVRVKAATGRLMGGRLVRAAFLLMALWLLLGFVIAPLLTTAVTSVSFDGSSWWAGYASYFSDEAQVRSIVNTLEVGALSVLTCGLVGTALAVYVRFFCRRLARLVRVLLMVPLMLPGVIIVVAFIQLYGESGMVTSAVKQLLGVSLPPFAGLGGIVLVITYTQYVYFYLNLTTALSFIDANVVDSVRSLGGGPWRVFAVAIWPTVRPAVIVSALTTFVSAIGSYSAPALIGGSFRVLSTQIVAAKSSFDMPLASVEVVVLFALGVVATAALSALRRHYEDTSSTRAHWWEPEICHAKVAAAVFRAFALVQLVLVLVPVVAIFYLSFMTTRSIMMDAMPTAFTLENYEKVFTNQRTFKPLGNSLLMALESTIAVLALGGAYGAPVAPKGGEGSAPPFGADGTSLVHAGQRDRHRPHQRIRPAVGVLLRRRAGGHVRDPPHRLRRLVDAPTAQLDPGRFGRCAPIGGGGGAQPGGVAPADVF